MITKACNCNKTKINLETDTYLTEKIYTLEKPSKTNMMGAASSLIHRKCSSPIHPKIINQWIESGKLGNGKTPGPEVRHTKRPLALIQ